MNKPYDFLFGAQYYRAPTPHPESWESDLKNMKANGFNCVKIWVQWGWTHRGENEFYFEDTDRLMDLAYENGLKVTINVIFDVAPRWVFRRYPESKLVTADGRVVEPTIAAHRQIGGFPGVCNNHDGAAAHRKEFFRQTVLHYRNHPALDMWDVWNEPEQCCLYRTPQLPTLTCFCPSCRAKFRAYLEEKYGTVEKLNQVWGRCYESFEEAELPTQAITFADFIDFREFQLDGQTREGNWRLAMAKELDPNHTAYLHVVPNTCSPFNSLTGVDDFALAENCDIFASTNFAQPVWSILTLSAGKGKLCYNVECHIGNGHTNMHQKQITLQDMVRDLVPQIGMGIRGFMFWQYRPEILGWESPAWGVTKLDGTPGSVGIAAKEFIGRLRPYIDEIMGSTPPKAEIAVWKGRRNEIFSYCIRNEVNTFGAALENYVNGVYYNNHPCRIVDDKGLNDLEGVKLLILPMCYAADAALVEAVDRFVTNGGTVLCEAHFGGYNIDTGRHSYTMPGAGADTLWKLRERYTTSAYHLPGEEGEGPATDAFNDDVKKAIASYGLAGGKYFPLRLQDGLTLVGAERFACVEGEGAEVIGTFGDEPCLVKQTRGKGTIYYCGTHLSEGATVRPEAFAAFLEQLAAEAGVTPSPVTAPRGVHADVISPRLIAVNNASGAPAEVRLGGAYKGVYSEAVTDENGAVTLPAATAELFVKI